MALSAGLGVGLLGNLVVSVREMLDGWIGKGVLLGVAWEGSDMCESQWVRETVRSGWYCLMRAWLRREWID